MTMTKRQATQELAARGISPRLLDVELAAAYVGLSPEPFLQAVLEQVYPAPLKRGRRKLWDVRALDAAIDRLSALPSSSARGDESPDALMRAIDAA